jgi:hypothetical protein
MLDRREAVLRLLFGAGLVGLRSLASGLPAAVLLDPRRAMAAGGADAGTPPTVKSPQFVIYSTSYNGDPVGCNAPGTYDDPGIEHPGDPAFAATPMSFGSRTVSGAQIGSTLVGCAVASGVGRGRSVHHRGGAVGSGVRGARREGIGRSGRVRDAARRRSVRL